MKKKKRKIIPRPRDLLLILLPVLIVLCLVSPALTSRRGSPRTPRKDQEADVTPPSIYLTRDTRYFVLPGELYEEEGYAAYDDRDGDITDRVDVSVGRDSVRYRVSDRAGNVTIRFRRIPRADGPAADG